MLSAIKPGQDAPEVLAHTKTNASMLQQLAPGTLLAGRYRIEAVLGVGGMGIVYRARDEELGLDVALKVLQSDLASQPEWIERFRRELVLAREVTHKNVVRIHDIGASDGLVFLSMRLVEGRALLEVLAHDGPLTLERGLNVVRQVAEALQHAHEAGVVHRDLKPANVLLGPDDSAYITDFGVARWLNRDGLTRSGVVVGTLDYLSPEQAAGGRVDARSDIYALGILLFEMLTGELPFRSDSKAEALAQRIAGQTRDVTETGVRVPAFVRRAIRRCLERHPSRRYASAAELIADLDARRVAPWALVPRAARWALVALALVAVPGVAWWHRGPALGPAALRRASVPVAVAVLPLTDDTGDAALGWAAAGVADMLAAQLAEAAQLRVLDSARVARTLADLGLQHAARDENEMRRLAEIYDVNRLVTGSVRRAGATLRVDLRVAAFDQPGRIETRTLAAETPDAGGLFRVVAELGGRLRTELGAAPAVDPPAGHTTSFAAERAYRDGRARAGAGDNAGAARAFEHAVEADREFTAAFLALSEAYQSMGRHDDALEAAESAARAGGSGETRLALRAQARLALLRDDPAGAEHAYAQLAQLFPNDTEALLELAAAQSAQGRAADAVATLKRATELDKGDARAWLLLGRNMILAGDVRKAATDPLVRALALMTQLGNEHGRADVLNAMGVAQQRLGEYAQAVVNYGEAAELRRRLGDEHGLAVSLKNRASVRLAMGHFDAAEPDLTLAQSIYTRLGDRKGLADVWNELGALHEGRGEYAPARGAYTQALRIRRELGDLRQLAQSYDNIGYGHFLEAEYDSALVYWQQALELRRKVGDRSGIVLSMQNLGFLQTAQGRFTLAMKSFLDALEKAREIDFQSAIAVSQGNIGLLQQYDGRYAAALSAYGAALETLEALGDRRGLAEFTIKEAVALIELGRWADARSKLEAAAGWVQATGNREQAADEQAAWGGLWLAQGDARAATEAFGRAVEHATASHSRAAILRASIGRSAARVALGQAAAAEPDLRKRLHEAEALGDAVLQIRAAEALAQAELQVGRLRLAEDAARVALQVGERIGFEAGLYRLHALAGRIREQRRDALGAATSYRESARRAALLRDALPPGERAAFDQVKTVREVAAWTDVHLATR